MRYPRLAAGDFVMQCKREIPLTGLGDKCVIGFEKELKS